MKSSRALKTVLAVGLSAACVLGVVGCSNGSTPGSSSNVSAEGGVAATVNGEPIAEDLVTNYIQSLRTQYGLTDESTWGQYLSSSGLTPESLRENIINSYVEIELMEQAAAEQGIVADDATVQGYIDNMKGNYDTEEKWQSALAGAGMTEDDYRAEIARQLISQEFSSQFASTEEPTEEEMLQLGQIYASTYDGAKRSSHILFKADDEATAKEVLEKVRSGELDFAEAAKTYSQDGSASNGGDVGWDKTSQFVSEYQEALNALEKDQISDLVVSDFGIHIIKCTDVFHAETTEDSEGNKTAVVNSMNDLPEEWVESIKATIQNQKGQQNYQAWLTEERETADVVINPMPSDVPYNVDMSNFSSTQPSVPGGDQSNGTVDETVTEDESQLEVQPEGENADGAKDGAQSEEPANGGEGPSNQGQ